MYQGYYFELKRRHQFAELIFNSKSDSVNTLSRKTLQELDSVITTISNSDIAGLIIRSEKKIFSAGANVTEFKAIFADGEKAIEDYLEWVQTVYNRMEDLDIPKVTIINGTAAGGGVELALLSEYRLGLTNAKISLPEVKLGIMPGWGGVTRLPRLLGLDSALQWLTTGKSMTAEKALIDGFLDGVICPDKVDPAVKAEQLLSACISGELDWKARRHLKQSPLPLNMYEQGLSLSVAKGLVAQVAGKHYPAPQILLDTIEKSVTESRDKALSRERKGISRCVSTGVADALVNVFLSDMAVKSQAKLIANGSEPVQQVGVIGAGIMGGGIAYVSAENKMDVVLKDIHKDGLNLGLQEANKILVKQLERKRITALEMGETLNRVVPTLSNVNLIDCDLVIEAVVENPLIKAKVLPELEVVAPNAVIASNTSSLAISGLAHSLANPENFCGIHFFNPVHKMPLVEVIRGEKTSEKTIAKAVKYCLQLGKVPVIVNDCAGFFINRILAPYMFAFNKLVLDGCEIGVIDKVMKNDFGWPMGPAHLHDIVGMDTASHVMEIMNESYVHMPKPDINLIDELYKIGKLGQKSGAGFYEYQLDRKGRLMPQKSEDTLAMLAEFCAPQKAFDSEYIIYRCMLPMMFEAIRCLDENIIASPEDADLAIIYGTGFPPFRGGIFYYMDQLGLDYILQIAEQYVAIDPIYQIPEGLKRRVQNNEKFYG